MPGVGRRGRQSEATKAEGPERCQQCSRDFANSTALNQHIVNSARHKTPLTFDPLLRRNSEEFIVACVRCSAAMPEREFESHSCGSDEDEDGGSWSDGYEHPDFNRCPECPEVVYGVSQLMEHWRMSGCRKVCEGCSTGFPNDEWRKHCRKNHACFDCHCHFKSRSQLMKHIRSTTCPTVPQKGGEEGGVQDEPASRAQDEHDHLCPHCNERHMNENNLKQHLLVHLSGGKQCWGCDLFFSTEAGILVHLESGTCSSRTCREEVNGWAVEVFQRKLFVQKDWVRRLKNRKSLDPGDVPFYCAGCDTGFSSLSGLFQHCASSACSQGLSDGPMERLKRWLSTQLRQYRQISE